MSIGKMDFLKSIRKGINNKVAKIVTNRITDNGYNKQTDMIMKRYIPNTIKLKPGIRNKRREEVRKMIIKGNISGAIKYVKGLKSKFDYDNYNKK